MASKARILAFPKLGTQQTAAQPITATREVTITSGVHMGGTFSVQDGDLIVIGADVGCDICLSDAGIAPRHAVIALHGRDVSIRGLDGPISVNDEDVVTTKRTSSEKSTVIAFGGSNVRLELVAAPGLQATPSTPPVKTATFKQRAIVLGCFAVFAVIATVLVAQKLDASLSAKPGKPDIAAVQALLNQQGLAKAVAASLTTNGVEVKGVLDRAAATKFRSAVAGSRQPIVDAVVIKEDLVEQVRDVFRTQGYDANVTHIGGARVQVDNLDQKHKRVKHAIEQVRADVPQLEELVLISPIDAAPPTDPPPYGNSAGDRIVTRIDGKTAYLVAGAGTRYFTGSKLPSGHTIRRITPEAVQVERDGQIEWFRF
jgi:type III secretion system YscD/HrpQ family protein